MADADARCSIGSFPVQYQAELACGRLTAEGLDAQIVNAGRRRGPWRVEVPRAEEARAREILREDHSALLDELFTGEDAGRPESACPACGAGDPVDLRDEPSLLYQLMGRPFWAKRWRCRQCDTRWR